MDEHVKPVMDGAEVGEGADRIENLQIGRAVADADAAGRRGDAAPGPLSPAAVLPDLAAECATAQAGGGRVVRTQVAIRCASPPPSGWA